MSSKDQTVKNAAISHPSKTRVNRKHRQLGPLLWSDHQNIKSEQQGLVKFHATLSKAKMIRSVNTLCRWLINHNTTILKEFHDNNSTGHRISHKGINAVY
jgi:hypothetical protein